MHKQKKKIIYLVTQPEHGGAATYVHDLATHLNSQEWDVYVASGENPQGWLFDEVKKYNSRITNYELRITTIYLKHTKRNLHLWHDIMSGFELFKLFKKNQPDIIHVNSSKIGATGSVIAKLYQFTSNLFKIKKLKFKIKVIYTVHGLVLNEPTLKKWQYLYYKLSEKISGLFEDKIICVSEFDHQSVFKHKIANPKKITTIHNGINLNIPFLSKEEAWSKMQGRKKQDTNNFQLPIYNLQTNPKYQITKQKQTIFNIGFIGNLYPNKGLCYLIEAFNFLITNYQLPITLTILSNGGPEKQNLENQIKKLNLENHIQFKSGQNAKLYLKAFDLFILPSIKEGLSYTLIEALAAELPIITTLTGGNPEIIQHEHNGLLVEPANHKSLAKAIHKIYSDQNFKNKLISNTHSSAQNFSLPIMLEKTLGVYNS